MFFTGKKKNKISINYFRKSFGIILIWEGGVTELYERTDLLKREKQERKERLTRKF